ncbi:hypothetical protein GCM10011571_20570 [Marinithermofilum abyssi]|uniref:SPOR domain-containing protein n=1 Tax=Marinithermofilum abyssi TaxID=1571185 RepID=A0A8J2YE70_9BACL|nr:SPOR domain-containing protein [Marinithermofilum abyssi]GGE18546.1 hypothetical protein GCM10011571_20570 [Marinithermofilum abyssi]
MEQPRITVQSKGKAVQKEITAGTRTPVSSAKHRPIQQDSSRVPVNQTKSPEQKKDLSAEKGRISFASLSIPWKDQEKWGEGIEWGSPHSNHPWGKKDRQPLRNLLISVGAAVLLGTLMGIVVLSLFFSGEPASSRSIDSHLKTFPGQMEKSGENQPQGNAADTVRLPALKAVLIQGGIYKEEAGAQQALRQLRAKGLAAILTDDSPYRIYLGTGINRDDALQLSNVIGEQEDRIYLKEVAVGEQGIPVKGNEVKKNMRAVTPFLKKGHELFQSMAQQTAKALGASTKPAALTEWDQVEGSYNQMMKEREQAEARVPDAAKPAFRQMVQALDQAFQTGKSGQSRTDAALLWQIQEGLVRYTLAYEKFVDTLQ